MSVSAMLMKRSALHPHINPAVMGGKMNAAWMKTRLVPEELRLERNVR